MSGRGLGGEALGRKPNTDPAPVVTAVDVVWRFTAVMGPSGSGTATLMHSKEA
jgi:hypothetical protein